MNARALFFAALVATGCGPREAPTCDRACLKGVLDSYLDALTKHDASRLSMSPAAKLTENGRTMALGEGLWKTAEAVTYRLDALDPTSGQMASETVVRENGELAHYLVRLKVDASGKISEVETILCRKGEQDLFAPDKLTTTPALYTQVVPAADRSSRNEMSAMADAYFTAVQTEGSANYKPAPLAVETNRFENGIQTTNVPIFGLPAASASEQLDKGFFKGLTLAHRRVPVIDEERGIALGIVVMQTALPHGVLLGEMFKISGGRIRQIQAVMVNHPNDGRTGWN